MTRTQFNKKRDMSIHVSFLIELPWQLFSGNCAGRTSGFTSAAIDAGIGVNHIFVVDDTDVRVYSCNTVSVVFNFVKHINVVHVIVLHIVLSVISGGVEEEIKQREIAKAPPRTNLSGDNRSRTKRDKTKGSRTKRDKTKREIKQRVIERE